MLTRANWPVTVTVATPFTDTLAPVTVTAQAWVRNASSESKPGRSMPST